MVSPKDFSLGLYERLIARLRDLLGGRFLFMAGMNWSNHGKWHIDHITPLSSAKTADELYTLCHYTNLQPLWAIDNLRKHDKIENGV
jgi:hypothetical protein